MCTSCSENAFLGSVLDAVSYKGGLLYLTSTDGFSSSGRRPVRSLAAYGCYSRPLPYANEQVPRVTHTHTHAHARIRSCVRTQQCNETRTAVHICRKGRMEDLSKRAACVCVCVGSAYAHWGSSEGSGCERYVCAEHACMHCTVKHAGGVLVAGTGRVRAPTCCAGVWLTPVFSLFSYHGKCIQQQQNSSRFLNLKRTTMQPGPKQPNDPHTNHSRRPLNNTVMPLSLSLRPTVHPHHASRESLPVLTVSSHRSSV